MLLIAGLLYLIISNFHIGMFNLKKIESQKRMDAIALEYGTQYARALNGLAALNEGLSIAANRGKLVTTVATILSACSVVPATAAVCRPLWERLSSKLPRFYRNLQKLGKNLVKQQEQIIDWMVQQRCADSKISWATSHDFDMYPRFDCHAFNRYADLPFHRSLNGSVFAMIDIPQPLQFKPSFFVDQNRMIFVSSQSSDSAADDVATRIRKPSKIWALSEIKIEGTDFEKMEFVPKLTAVSLVHQLSNTNLNLQSVKNEINH